MQQNPLLKLQSLGQSVWLDYLRRGLIASGDLGRLVAEDGLRGVTSNPSIFQNAISGSHDYDQQIAELVAEGRSAAEVYEAIAVQDIRSAADVFRPTYDALGGRDGFVSIEVSPSLAHDADGTIREARRLWGEIARPNVLIKVPATREGLVAIRRLIGEGINVNVTLLFGLPRYREVVDAYLGGLEDLAGAGGEIGRIASVASFFLSRIDTAVDPQLERMMLGSGEMAELARRAHGQVAIASAKMAYSTYKDIFTSDRFSALKSRGARPQRLLWASTSSKNPAYSDVKYVEPLIGPDTVNTMPTETLNAYRDHGDPAPRLTEGLDEAKAVLEGLPSLGIQLDEVTANLEAEGVRKFADAFSKLISALDQKRPSIATATTDPHYYEFGSEAEHVEQRTDALQSQNACGRLWRADGSLWKQEPEQKKAISRMMGWLHAPERMEGELAGLREFGRRAREDGFTHVVHMGMGGSSLAPLVFHNLFGDRSDGLSLRVLDTTDPTTLLALERSIPLEHTLFIVASKSGTTTEPLAFAEFFYHRLRALRGEDAREQMVAITDPGTPLEEQAMKRGYRAVFHGFPDVGGRYSALTAFGLVPASLAGVDVEQLLERSLRMVRACDACVPAPANPGVSLGAAIGEMAARGRDKLTFILPDRLLSLGMWLEQLLAESTGKEGRGILPVAGEKPGRPTVYGRDRVFVAIQVEGQEDPAVERAADALRAEGRPVATFRMADPMEIGQEMYRWEVATAIAGAVLGINPFDQPNVQESKENTSKILAQVESRGRLPVLQPSLEDGQLALHGDVRGASVEEALVGFMRQATEGSYFAVQAYLPETPPNHAALQRLRLSVRDTLHVATTLGYGPRYLHSTGQYHKGGPNTGLFLQITMDDPEDVAIPGRSYTFGVLRRSQAQGDMQALQRHGRRVLGVHVSGDVPVGLERLADQMAAAVHGLAPAMAAS